ncbi:MAG: (2Fe-2S)-binding protein [Synergistaceae bacterium]|jgi:bacterioferritin-associated ferredoxin|nr:(2Fe-2S)-binding protein [Synergistaceae bacterium]
MANGETENDLRGLNEDDSIVCRCEEVAMSEVRKWIAGGYDTPDELKRLLRVGMGPCQGRGCREIILREISSMTGVPVSEIPPGRIRPPAKPVKISLVARDYTGGDGR